MIDKKDAQKKGLEIVDTSKIRDAFLENLKANFPQTIKEGRADLKTIATLLGLSDEKAPQAYGLNFIGKGLAHELYSTPTQKCLKVQEHFRPEPSTETATAAKKAPATPQNFIIRGDNLDALKILKAAYTEKIKMIYIDPPYNTKNENFIYPDNFREDYQELLRTLGLIEIDDEGREVESEALKFISNIQATRTHSGWLAFILPRLKLARDLLREDGVIFISIDDNEQANLKILCDEIFGEDNFVSCFVWQKKSGGGQAKYFYEGHEYLLIYCKDKSLFNGLYKVGKGQEIENDIIRKIHGKYTKSQKLKELYEKYPTELIEHRNLMFEELDIFLKEKMIGEKKYNDIKKKLENGEYFLKPFNEKFNLICRYNEDNLSLMYSVLNGVYNSDGANELEAIFDSKLIFDSPKPSGFLKQFFAKNTSDDDIILDFFAGSGTTAQAVMELNSEDGGRRKFILVQIDEPINKNKNEVAKAAYDFCKNTLKSPAPLISDITIERVKRAAAKISKDSPKNAFSVLSLEDKPKLITTKKDELALTDKSPLAPRDKALNLALHNGKFLHQDLEEIFSDRLYKCEDRFYLIACDEEVLAFLRKEQGKEIHIDGYGEFKLDDFLNLKTNHSLKVIY